MFGLGKTFQPSLTTNTLAYMLDMLTKNMFNEIVNIIKLLLSLTVHKSKLECLSLAKTLRPSLATNTLAYLQR